MLERKDFYNMVHFEYGVADYGSYKGLRYRIAVEPFVKLFGMKPDQRPENLKLRAYAWSEPWNFETTESKESADFDYSEEGINEAIAWLNEQWKKITGQ